MVNKIADMKIQQMTFMIIFVFIFFAIVGLFVLSMNLGGLKQSYINLQREAAIASIETIANMPELNCESSKTLCLDEDKLYVFASSTGFYKDFWPVASIKVRKIYPQYSKQIRCPSANCTFYDIYNSGQSNVQEYATFVSICKKVNRQGRIYDECGIGTLEVGIKIPNA